MLNLTLCNELLAADGLSLAEQAQVAAELGYMGLEFAPATLGDTPHRLDDKAIADIRRTVEDAGIRVTGLHWLLSRHPDASTTDPDRQAETQEVLVGLIGLCADLGGKVLIHGSPGQRLRPEGMSEDQLTRHLAAFFAPVAATAERAGVTYCIEPLARVETETITTIAEAVAVVEAVAQTAVEQRAVETQTTLFNDDTPADDTLMRRLVDDTLMRRVTVTAGCAGVAVGAAAIFILKAIAGRTR